jgi:molecular chaperone Hsp33
VVVEDRLITALNGAQDITVKVVSCANVLQETMNRLNYSQQVAETYGELLTGSLLMASNMKGDETIQVNLVGNTGVKNMFVVADGALKVKGQVGLPSFILGNGDEKLGVRDILGDGQLQVIRNHPLWKNPMNGIVSIRDVSISLNLALYMTESEQRLAAIISDVKIVDGQCKYAIGIMVERLPGAQDGNVEMSIKNLEDIAKKGFGTYLTTSGIFDHNELLNTIVDDCLIGMDKDSIRWSKQPAFSCACGITKVWGALRLLPSTDIDDIIEDGKGVEV